MSDGKYDGAGVRQSCRLGQWTGCTAGLAPGYVQGNVTILPQADAYDFLVYCLRNPKPCPVLDVSDVGDYMHPRLGEDVDIRKDLPKYVLHRDDKEEEIEDITNHWRDDFVSVVCGCSFSFEEALIRKGISIRHTEENVIVPMFITNQQTVPSGPFSGPLIVSMRPIKRDLVDRVIEITSSFPESHGAPVHIDHPSELGIQHLERPDFGDAVSVREDEIPVFWACGVTNQLALMNSALPLWITHAPGHMIVTDIPNKKHKLKMKRDS